MALHPLAVIGHVGPDFSGETMEEARALAALCRVRASDAALDFPPIGAQGACRNNGGCARRGGGMPAQHAFDARRHSGASRIGNRQARGPDHQLPSRFRRNAGAHCLPRYGLLRRPARTMRSFQCTGTSGVRLSANRTIKEESEQKRTAMTWTPTRAALSASLDANWQRNQSFALSSVCHLKVIEQ